MLQQEIEKAQREQNQVQANSRLSLTQNEDLFLVKCLTC
jgi:hypothetical protein